MSGNNPLTQQIGGNHYASLKYQPINFATDAKLTPCQFSVVKYVTRYKDKNGLQDLQKAMHFCDIGANIDGKQTDDDTAWLSALIYRYVQENELSPEQDSAISHVVMNMDYAAAKRVIEMMIREYK